jgi:type IV pilus assembly protein PilW
MQLAKEPKTGGFTLVELMVTLAIGMVVMAAVTTTFISQTRFYSAQEQINEMEQNARGAIDIMTREIKMAGYDPTGAGFAKVTTFTSTQLAFQTDYDGSGGPLSNVAANNEKIAYAYDSTNRQINRTAGSGGSGQTQTLADNITAATFTYYKADGSTATVATDIRQIKISITARTAKPDPNFSSNGGYRTYQLTATITPVNLAL